MMDDKSLRFWAKAYKWDGYEATELIVFGVSPRLKGGLSGECLSEQYNESDLFHQHLKHYLGDRVDSIFLLEFPFVEKWSPADWIDACDKSDFPVPDELRAAVGATDTQKAREADTIRDMNAMRDEIDSLKRSKEHDGQSRNHVSDKLATLNQAAQKFWGNADRNERGTHPENAMVKAWLLERGYTNTLADKAATIIRPEWAPTGRKPQE